MPDQKLSDAVVGRGLLVLALLSGCGLMWPYLSGGPLVPDEHVAYWKASADSPGTLLERSLTYSAPLPPLSPLMQRGFLAVTAHNEMMFRLPSALCYLGAIVVCYLLGSELLGGVAGGVSALLVAWHPDALDEVRIARCYGLLLLLSACSFWITIRWLKRPDRFGWIIGWAVVNAALIWTHYMAIPVPAIELAVLAFAGSRKGRLGTLCVGGILLVLLVSPLGYSFLWLWESSPLLNYSNQAIPFWEIVGPIWWFGLPLGWCLGLAINLWRPDGSSQQPERLRSLLCLAIWSLVPLLFVAAVSRGGSLTTLANRRYRIMYAIPGACLIAGLLTYRRSAAAACAGVAGVLGASWALEGLPPWQAAIIGNHREAEWKAMAAIVERQGTSEEPLFVQSGLVECNFLPIFYSDPKFMDYMTCRLVCFYLRAPHPRYGLPFHWKLSKEMRQFYNDVLERTGQTRESGLWVAAATDTDLNRNSLEGFQRLLAEHNYVPVDEEHFEFSTLLHYRRPEKTKSDAATEN